MKNTACEIYLSDPVMAYQVSFGYIRGLAVKLRNSMKGNSKDQNGEAYKQVYNWQFAHAVDFFAMLLSRSEEEDSELKPLIYPLVQVTLGAIKYV